MADDDHQKIIEGVLELVRRQLQESGMLQFTALTMNEQGNERCIDIDRNSSAAKRTRTS